MLALCLAYEAIDQAIVASHNDCAAAEGTQPQVIQPGERLTFEVVWAGRTSAPGCPEQRTAVGAGPYQVQSRLGTLPGQPAQLQLTA